MYCSSSSTVRLCAGRDVSVSVTSGRLNSYSHYEFSLRVRGLLFQDSGGLLSAKTTCVNKYDQKWRKKEMTRINKWWQTFSFWPFPSILVMWCAGDGERAIIRKGNIKHIRQAVFFKLLQGRIVLWALWLRRPSGGKYLQILQKTGLGNEGKTLNFTSKTDLIPITA